MRMSRFFIVLAIIMCIVLAGVQIIRISPAGKDLSEDSFTGVKLKPFQSLVIRGTVTLDILGDYRMHQVMIYNNGERYLLVEKFPVTVNVLDGDVLEAWVLGKLPGASLIVKSISDEIALKYSRTSLVLEKGLHRIGKVIAKKESAEQ